MTKDLKVEDFHDFIQRCSITVSFQHTIQTGLIHPHRSLVDSGIFVFALPSYNQSGVHGNTAADHEELTALFRNTAPPSTDRILVTWLGSLADTNTGTHPNGQPFLLQHN